MSILETISEKMTLRRRIILLLVVVALVLLTVFSLTFRDKLGLNPFTRFLTYDNETSNVSFPHNARSEDLFVSLDFKLLACSEGAIQLFSGTGSTLASQQVEMEHPVAATNGKQAVIYDAGGHTLYVISKDKLIKPLELTEDQYILSATLNEKGWLAVTTKEDGYKGVITILNSEFELFGSIRLSSYYLTNAIVSSDCTGIYALAATQSEGTYESKVLYYSFEQRTVQEDDPEDLVLEAPIIGGEAPSESENEEEPAVSASRAEDPVSQNSLGNSVVLMMKEFSNFCWILTENALYIFTTSGELSAKYDFSGEYLKRASLDGTGFATLLLSHSPSGSAGKLVTIDHEGIVLGAKEFDDQILYLTSAGRYLAVLTPNGIQVFNKDLGEISSSSHIQGVHSISMFPDGTLAQILDETVRLYIP